MNTFADCDEIWEEGDDDIEELDPVMCGPRRPLFASVQDQRGRVLSMWMVGFLVLHSKYYNLIVRSVVGGDHSAPVPILSGIMLLVH